MLPLNGEKDISCLYRDKELVMYTTERTVAEHNVDFRHPRVVETP